MEEFTIWQIQAAFTYSLKHGTLALHKQYTQWPDSGIRHVPCSQGSKILRIDMHDLHCVINKCQKLDPNVNNGLHGIKVICSFFILSVLPSSFNKHVTFTTENEGQSLLRPELGYGTSVCWDLTLLWLAPYHPYKAASQSSLFLGSPLFITLLGPRAQNKDTAFEGLLPAWGLCRAQPSLAPENRKGQFRWRPSPVTRSDLGSWKGAQTYLLAGETEHHTDSVNSGCRRQRDDKS